MVIESLLLLFDLKLNFDVIFNKLIFKYEERKAAHVQQ